MSLIHFISNVVDWRVFSCMPEVLKFVGHQQIYVLVVKLWRFLDVHECKVLVGGVRYCVVVGVRQREWPVSHLFETEPHLRPVGVLLHLSGYVTNFSFLIRFVSCVLMDQNYRRLIHVLWNFLYLQHILSKVVV